MSQECFAAGCVAVGRVAVVDSCTGEFSTDPNTQYVFGGIISATWEPVVEEGESTTVKDMCGNICLRDKQCNQTTGYTVEITLCKPDNELVSLLTGEPAILDVGGDTIGYFQLDDSNCAPFVSLELWEKLPESQCTDGVQYRRIIFPKIRITQGAPERQGPIRLLKLTGLAESSLGDSWATGPQGDSPTDFADLMTATQKFTMAEVYDTFAPDAACGYSAAQLLGYRIDNSLTSTRGGAVASDGSGNYFVGADTGDVSPTIDALVMKYDSAGALVPAFGTAGRVTIDVDDVDNIKDVKYNTVDGKLYVLFDSGDGVTQYAHVARLNATTGALDATWGVAGISDISVNESKLSYGSMAIESDGSVVVAWVDSFVDPDDGKLSRLDSVGAVVDTVALAHHVVASYRIADGQYAVSLYDAATGNDIYAALVDIDLATVTESLAVAHAGAASDYIPVIVDALGNIYVGYGLSATPQIARFDNTATLDPTWGVAGIAGDTVAGWVGAYAYSLTLLNASTDIAVVGTYGSMTENGAFVQRYDDTGDIVTTFGTLGTLQSMIDPVNFSTYAIDVVESPNNRLVLTGTNDIGTDAREFIMRINATTGALDTTFGS